MVVSTLNTNVNRDDDNDYDETDNSSQEESEYEFSEEEDEEDDDNSEVSEEEDEAEESEEETLPAVAALPPRNVVVPVRLIDEQPRFTQGKYHGWVDQWDRDFNGHKPE